MKGPEDDEYDPATLAQDCRKAAEAVSNMPARALYPFFDLVEMRLRQAAMEIDRLNRAE